MDHVILFVVISVKIIVKKLQEIVYNVIMIKGILMMIATVFMAIMKKVIIRLKHVENVQ